MRSLWRRWPGVTPAAAGERKHRFGGHLQGARTGHGLEPRTGGRQRQAATGGDPTGRDGAEAPGGRLCGLVLRRRQRQTDRERHHRRGRGDGDGPRCVRSAGQAQPAASWTASRPSSTTPPAARAAPPTARSRVVRTTSACRPGRSIRSRTRCWSASPRSRSRRPSGCWPTSAMRSRSRRSRRRPSRRRTGWTAATPSTAPRARQASTCATRRTGAKYLLTAGHCVNAGSSLSGQGGVNFGSVLESWFPSYDDAIVRNDNTGYWIQGPWVDTNPVERWHRHLERLHRRAGRHGHLQVRHHDEVDLRHDHGQEPDGHVHRRQHHLRPDPPQRVRRAGRLRRREHLGLGCDTASRGRHQRCVADRVGRREALRRCDLRLARLPEHLVVLPDRRQPRLLRPEVRRLDLVNRSSTNVLS